MSERHERAVRAPAEVAYRAALAYRPGASRLWRSLFALRALPRLLSGQPWPPREWGEDLLTQAQRMGAIRLAEDPGREIVFGLAGRFWRPTGEMVRFAGAGEFATFARDGYARAAVNVRVDALDDRSLLGTETRVQLFGAAARRAFRLYWLVVRPGSAWLRVVALREIARAAEAQTTLR